MSKAEIGGDSAKFFSDGLTLQLENGRAVRPSIRDPESNEPWHANWVDPESGEVGLGPEVDDTRVVLYLSPAQAVFDQDGNRVYHYEWNGWLWCDREDDAFDAEEYWDTGEITCPHCGDGIVSPVAEDDSPPEGFDYGEKREDGQFENHPTIDEGEFKRPVRTEYVHTDGCGETTHMSEELAESLARDPDYYSKTFCANCGDYFPLEEFQWKHHDETVGS